MRSGFGLALRLLGVGWYLALSVVLGIGAGLWLDTRLNTQHLFTLLGLMLGLVVALYGTYRMVRQLLNNED